MRIDEIASTFEQITKTGEFICYLGTQTGEVVVYTAEANINIVGYMHTIAIDINFYIPQHTTIFVMNISNGFWGDKSQLMDRLLLNINTMTIVGQFGYWRGGDIVFRHDVAIDYLDYDKIIRILRYFEQVYVGIRPKLEMYASEWNLRYISDEQQQQAAKELSWFIDGIRRPLLDNPFGI